MSTLVRWYGQSAFLVEGEQSVFIDPFGDMGAMSARGLEFRYPLIDDVSADLLLVTHEHFDHNGVEAVGGDPVVIRSAGTHESPVGEVVAIASEHDDVAGTARGSNVIAAGSPLTVWPGGHHIEQRRVHTSNARAGGTPTSNSTTSGWSSIAGVRVLSD